MNLPASLKNVSLTHPLAWLAEGSRQKALETARLMKQASCEITFIEKMTGLSAEEIAQL